MNKYLMAGLLCLASLLSFAQGGTSDIPIKETVTPPSLEFLRPILRPSVGEIEYRKADGSYWNGRKQRDPRIFYNWPPYLIANPVIGDQTMGPSATADTSQRQYAIYNGNRWVEYGGVANELTFGSAFTKTGTQVNLAQYPYSVGKIHSEQFSLANPPVKPSNPLQHSFMLYNPANGIFEGMPYADVVSAMGVRQWPSGSLGSIGVDKLSWATPAQQLSASSLNLMNASLLMTFGSDTYRMSMGDYTAFLATRLSGTSLKALRRVAPVKNHLEPGQEGDYFWYRRKFHLSIEKEAGKTMWIAWAPDTTFNYDVVPGSIAAPVLRYTGVPDPTTQSLAWIWNGSDATGFRLYRSKGDTLSYQALSPDISAGARSFDVRNLSPLTKYFYKIAVLTPAGQSPLSNTISATTPPADNFTVWPNVKNVFVTQVGATQAKVEFDIAENGGGVAFYITRQNAPDVIRDELWDHAGGMELGAAGHYSLLINNINDSDFRYLRYSRTSISNDGKAPSPWERYGPFSMNGGITVNTPVITGVTNITSNSLTLNLNLNNTNIRRVILYTSSNNQITFFSRDIPVGNSYNVTGLASGTKHFFHIQVTKMDGSVEKYSANSTPETEATTLGTSTTEVGPTFTNFSFKANSTDAEYNYDNLFGSNYEFKFSYRSIVEYSSYSCEYDYRINNGPWIQGVSNDGVVNTLLKKGYSSLTATHVAQMESPGNVVRVRIRGLLFVGTTVTRSPWSENTLKITYGPNFPANPNDRTWELENVSDQTPAGQVPGSSQPVTLALSGTSATNTTITVTNHGSGTKNYSWAVYEGEFNNGGVWKRCAQDNIPSTGSFTVDISSCGLSPGVTYRMYVTETANADAKRGWVEFTVPSAPVNPDPGTSTSTFRTSSYISN